MSTPSAPGSSPRATITADSFAVAPHLLGLPLARPWRRAVAIAIDLLLIAILAQAGFGPLALLGGGAILWFSRRAAQPVGGWWERRVLRVLGWGLLLTGVGTTLNQQVDGDRALREGVRVAETGRLGEGARKAASAGLVVADLQRIQAADDVEEARETIARLEERMADIGAGSEGVRAALEQAAEQVPEGKAWLRAELAAASARAAAGAAGDGAGAPADTARTPAALARRYAAAVDADDARAADSIAEALAPIVARDTLVRLRGELREAREEVEALKEERAEEEEPAWRRIPKLVAEELGSELGWGALYFTLFPVIWRGRTPGKRLLGIRVLRLTGAPMTWWGAFERFGGYAAGLATGLLGFAQCLWDRNRQSVHDKIAGTVVVRARD